MCKMKILHFDCRNGVSGDMVFKALTALGDCEREVKEAIEAADFSQSVHQHHGRGYHEVKQIIAASGFSQKTRDYADAIYLTIAEAEAEVHKASLDTVHFHEVGRDQAIKNALGIGMALEKILPDKITVSPINDGRGTITCSHGEIEVPVPAVKAMMKCSTFTFHQTDVEAELVTPSGLASLIGIGAEPADTCNMHYTLIKHTEACGTRDTGRGGLKVYIFEE